MAWNQNGHKNIVVLNVTFQNITISVQCIIIPKLISWMVLDIVPINIQNDVVKEVERKLDLKIIEPSNSPFSNPIIPVVKKNGT